MRASLATAALPIIAAAIALGVSSCSQAAPGAPELMQTVSCRVGSPNGAERTVQLRIPGAFERGEVNEGTAGCLWETERTSVRVEAVDPDRYARPLRDDYEGLRGDVGTGGDDDIEDLRFETAVEVFPGRNGSRLSFYSYSDGSPSDAISGQADDIIVTVSRDRQEGPDPDLRVRPAVRTLYDAVADTVRIERD